MIYEERRYDTTSAWRDEQIKYLGEQAVPIMVKHGAKFIGMWETIIGERNHVFVLLGWDNLHHREVAWEKIVKDPDFRPQLCSTDSQICVSCYARSLAVNILRPAEYSPLK